MTSEENQREPLLAPVKLFREEGLADAVSQSLAILSTVYHYNHWIFDSIRQYLGAEILEVGAGVGNITQFMLNATRLVCLEPFKPYEDYLRVRFARHLNVSVLGVRIEDIADCGLRIDDCRLKIDDREPRHRGGTPSHNPQSAICNQQSAFDSVVCLNVLEHIEEDIEALTRMRQLLRPEGNVIVLVPAMPWLYGEMDRAMGHIRRYTLGSLKSAFHAAGLRPVHGRYMNMVGALGWLYNGRIRKQATIPASATRMFDRWVPLLSAFERIIPPIFGQSVFVVGRRH